MKHLFLKTQLFLFFLFIFCHSQAQKLDRVTFNNGNAFSYFTITTNDGVLIRMDDMGKIVEWGYEREALRSPGFYAKELQPYLGRVMYYGNESDSSFIGKIKSIGTTTITYYWPTEQEYRRGRIKSIGSLLLDYYNEFDNKAFRKKLKFIGDRQISYYPEPDMQKFDGRLKSIGNIPITYYTVFDNRLLTGKLKSAGTVTYEWYTSADRAGFSGQLKGNKWRQNVSGIMFVLR